MHVISLIASDISRSLSSVASGADPDREALLKVSDHYFHWLLGFTALVAVGCIMEIGEACSELLEWQWHRKNTPFQEDKTRWTIPLSIAGIVFVIIGVAGEGYCELKQASAETAIRAYDEQKLADAVIKAGEAKDSAKAAIDSAARAKLLADLVSKRADELNGRMDTASAKLDKLQGRLAWRRIPQPLITASAEKLIKFPGSAVRLMVVGRGNPEVDGFAKDFLKILNGANWKYQLSLIGTSSGNPTGLRCRVDERTEAGKALFAVLKKLPSASVTPEQLQGVVAEITLAPMSPP